MIFSALQKVQRRAIYYGLGGGAAVVALALVYWFYLAPPAPPAQVGERQFVGVSLTPGVEDCATYVAGGSPTAFLCVKDNRLLVLSWRDLPRNTADIKIYRAREGMNELALWQTISVSGGGGGELVLAIGGTGGISEFSSFVYYLEAVAGSGEIVFTSVASTTETSEQTSTATPTVTETHTVSTTGTPTFTVTETVTETWTLMETPSNTPTVTPTYTVIG
ncbi:MAG: hypothetical protein AAB601_01705, partial [Patescibacteria group bacterium]